MKTEGVGLWRGEIRVLFQGRVQRASFNDVGPAEASLGLLRSGYSKPDPISDEEAKLNPYRTSLQAAALIGALHGLAGSGRPAPGRF